MKKLNHDKFTKDRAFAVNDKVFVNNHQETLTWLEGIVTEITGPLSYKIKLNDGSIVCRHIDHIRIHHSPPQQDISTEAVIDDSFMFLEHQLSTSPNGTFETAPQQSPVLRRSTRVKCPPDRFS